MMVHATLYCSLIINAARVWSLASKIKIKIYTVYKTNPVQRQVCTTQQGLENQSEKRVVFRFLVGRREEKK